ncbi:hypothetical protein C1H76_4682 [Elsinoe australis]|uniref:Uncharacterized protein n=1 Tax=Elsinoe australis TaxID=40998 RepID=A0A4U7B4T0_9PEZI|nr:hypothetical protein C1H76_4682 [Elsinoe australis]
MFTSKDISQILSLFPPSAIKDESPSFLLSKDGEQLVPFSTAQRKLQNQLATHGSVSVSSLGSLLDVRDTSPVIAWADKQLNFSTPNHRRPDVPPWIQKVVAVYFFYHAARRPVRTEDAAFIFSLDEIVVEQLVQAYARSFFTLIAIEDWRLAATLKRNEIARLRRLVKEAQSTATEIEIFRGSTWPRVVLEVLVREAVDAESINEYELRQRGHTVWSVPTAAMQQKAGGLVEDLVNQYIKDIDTKDWCIIREEDSMQTAVLERLKNSDQKRGLVELEKDRQIDTDSWARDSAVLVSKHKVEETTSLLAKLLHDAAQRIWQETQDRDLAFSPKVRSLLLTTIDSLDIPPSEKLIQTLFLSSTILPSRLQELYTIQLTNISTTASQSHLTTIRNDLQLPLHLYTASLSLTTPDPTLHEHQNSFIFDFIKSDILPAFNKALSTLALPPPKSLATELSKFRSAMQEARNIDAIQTATKRFSRKIKLPDASNPLTRDAGRSLASPSTNSRAQSRAISEDATSPIASPDLTERTASPLSPGSNLASQESGLGDLRRVQNEILQQKLQILKRAKRPSDVLQQATWILIAAVSDEPVLFVSAGRDAGRVVRLYQRIASGRLGQGVQTVGQGGKEGEVDWVDAGRVLEEFREKVKAGTHSGEEVGRVRGLASKALLGL